MKKQITIVSIAMILATAFTGWLSPAYAAEDPIYTSLFSNKAAKGYDVTAYFSDSKPIEGKSKYSTTYKGAEWLFANQENLDKFIADPEKYAPQYGGYCAYAAALGETVSADPEQWTIHEGRLFLNYDKAVNKIWLADKEGFIKKADQNWPTLLD